MNGIRRIAAVAVVAVGAMLTTIGFASSASAAYAPDPSPTTWTPDGAVLAVVTAGNRTYVGGAFTGGVAALDSTGALLWRGTANNTVRALALSSDASRLLAGGAFTSVSGATHRKLASLSPTTGAADPTWRGAAGGLVRDMVVNGDVVYYGGTFQTHQGISQVGVGANVVSTGRPYTAFTASTDAKVFGLAISNGRLFMAGSFTTVNGFARNSLASVTLATNSLDAWNPDRISSGSTQYWDVAVNATTAYVGTSGNRLGAVDVNSGALRFRVQANGDVQALALADGKLYAGGHFGVLAGQDRVILGAVDQTTGALDPNFVPTFRTRYPGIWALSATTTKLTVGGYFTAAGVFPPLRYPFLAFFSAT
jgi:hypothetical protein